MRLGDLLIRASVVTAQEVTRALQRMSEQGGRLGENLVALGIIEKQTLEDFLHRIPAEPTSLAETGIDDGELLALLMKLIYTGRLGTMRQYVDVIKLPALLVMELARMAVDAHLLHALGSRNSESLLDMAYALTDEGRKMVNESLTRSQYVGPAPVSIEQFSEQVSLQKPTNERISVERILNAFAGITFDNPLLEQAGPALNSGRAILLYGPPGNGKSTIARSFANIFRDVIYVPYAISIEGQIIRFHDPVIHLPVNPVEGGESDDEFSFVRRETYDMRWLPSRRPFVVVGGELTLDMLDLRYNSAGLFYEAPLHMKALGGCFLIDDFGRQLVSPTHLLNRWIVPLESRVDYLKLHNGKSFTIPFEELIIFSTNLDPEGLMDPAFLRRIPYKIEIGAPSLERYREIFEKECASQNLVLSSETFHYIVGKVTEEKGLAPAAYQPRFIVDQIVATCRFLGEPPQLKPRYIDYALDNLTVHRSANAQPGAPAAARI
jgi:energy-coupling factor transporter ATP-binding protein EcfA2